MTRNACSWKDLRTSISRRLILRAGETVDLKALPVQIMSRLIKSKYSTSMANICHYIMLTRLVCKGMSYWSRNQPKHVILRTWTQNIIKKTLVSELSLLKAYIYNIYIRLLSLFFSTDGTGTHWTWSSPLDLFSHPKELRELSLDCRSVEASSDGRLWTALTFFNIFIFIYNHIYNIWFHINYIRCSYCTVTHINYI